MSGDTGRRKRPKGLAVLADRYRCLICDLWGVLYDGRRAFPEALEALRRFRDTGGHVVILSNAPRPSSTVGPAIARRGIDAQVIDGLITSGDLVRDMVCRTFAGARAWHLGPAEDSDTLAGLPLAFSDAPAEADVIIATGLSMPEVEAHRELLMPAARRRVPLLCANPDRIVIHGGREEICAGAVADLYAGLGGPVHWLGKPAPPAYEACRRFFAEMAGEAVPDNAILVIGDSLVTDIAGARREGLDSLFIESGIHGADIAARGRNAVEEAHRVAPDYRLRRLIW
ncbi:MAG: TIGR01459 family HAD-type hydrolase [Alphaproteobacteria bacterium]|nr:MAG: TIGR01459 family HAD-type hydrolase [Alphaproteobacteria bacterium]